MHQCKSRASVAAVLLIVLGVTACCQQTFEASILVREDLSTVRSVAVNVRVPRFEPLPGLRPDNLQSQIEGQATEILESYGLEVADSSSQKLYVMVENQILPCSSGESVVTLLVELAEPVVLLREWPGQGKKDLLAITWKKEQSILFTPGVTAVDISESIGDLIDLFSEEVASARSHLAENS
jgi:hypothetical protein